jgi:hypothetical protein
VIPGVRVTTIGADGEIPDSSGYPDIAHAAAMANLVSQPLGMTPDPPKPFKDPDVARALVDKFPSFDPAWPEKTKKAWFDGFSELLLIIKGD